MLTTVFEIVRFHPAGAADVGTMSIRLNHQRGMRMKCLRTLVLFPALLLPATRVAAQAPLQVFTDQVSYNVGSEVRLKVLGTSGSSPLAGLHLTASIRYAGESQPVADHLSLDSLLRSPGAAATPAPSGAHVVVWKIPPEARTGRYEIAVSGQGPGGFELTRAAAFVVYRKLLRIEEIRLDKTFYTSGDPVAALVKVRNLTQHTLEGLRVEFSVRYWPWTAQSSERAGVDFVLLADALTLPAGAQKEIRSKQAALAETVKQPSARQYAAAVWDRQRQNLIEIAFSPIVFIHPPGVDSPRPYAGPPGFPLQYLHADFNSVNTSSYRHFYPPELDSAAIQFDHSHTMFASGSEGSVSFSVRNPTEAPWHAVSVRARLLGPDGAELQSRSVAEAAELEPGAPAARKEVKFDFPADASGLYRAAVEVKNPSGEVLASNALELGLNPLPQSILIFCAHQDDEGAHLGIIRAAVENQIPIHFVYFTSGDAGSCDRYYQHFCAPPEALNFGALRMDEARAALGHLGVPRGTIFFLGLPDGGSGQIWNHVSPSNPYLSVLLATDHAPYEDLARPNLPYARDSVVEVAKELIKKFQPEVIYTGHPDERHVDHRTNNWFVGKALQDLLREGSISPRLKLLVDQSYGPGPQAHAPYRYEKRVLHVSGEAMALAQEARWFHQSQDGNRAEGDLRTFDQLRRTEIHWEVLDWKDHEGWNEKN
jgi:LmbE family N-acetylglucosaminyl deacetylase